MSESLVFEQQDTCSLNAISVNDEQVRAPYEQTLHCLTLLHTCDEVVASQKVQFRESEHRFTVSETENRSLMERMHHTKEIETQWRENEQELIAVRHHNTELLRTLNQQQCASDALETQNRSLRAELEALLSQETLFKQTQMEQQVSSKMNQSLQAKIESVEMEKEQLRRNFSDRMLTVQVEMETLQDHLCVRKEKQYQFLARTRQLEEQLREKESNVVRMSQTLEENETKLSEMEAQWRAEFHAKRNQLQVNEQLSAECSKMIQDTQEMQLRMDKNEQEKSRLEAEFRQASEQLREMADKVFQLLERLKASESAKNRAMDAQKHQQIQIAASEKRNAGLQKEIVKLDQIRSKLESEKQIVSDQLPEMKKSLTQMSVRFTEQEKVKLRALEESKNFEEKTSFLSGRVAHLLRKMQTEEEARQLLKEDVKKLSSQLASYQQRHSEVSQNQLTMARNAQIMTQALKQCEVERNEFKARLDVALKKVEVEAPRSARRSEYGQSIQSRFIVEVGPSMGPNGLTLKARRSESVASFHAAEEFLTRYAIHSFITNALKHSKPNQMLTEKIGQLLTRLMISEERNSECSKLLASKSEELNDAIHRVTTWKSKVDMEVDVKRRLLLRYVHQVRCQAEDSRLESGILRLTKGGIGDEEVHAIASLLQSENEIRELHLESNCITNEGARAIAAILNQSHCALRYIDLRRNQIGKNGIQLIADALERDIRSARVCVHSGRLEAFADATCTETHCVIDISDNTSPIPLQDGCKVSPIPDSGWKDKVRVESSQHVWNRSRGNSVEDPFGAMHPCEASMKSSPQRSNAGCKAEIAAFKEMRCKWNGAERKLPPLLLIDSSTSPSTDSRRDDVSQEPVDRLSRRNDPILECDT
uniref:Uncharacterized protein AlNc14C23G2340 n=1 Tax=Albugo laibachii Nc14 TaxID=890382 RepID=F0W638_9STRA|nr:conserved hypothetical protein [Albugo laibachii Nc14]|eukprot:CCA16580.1 conserved hypothetical protein [Albugo laibachii Nc14]